ncbi:hypothetical protein ACIREK_35500 [Streptomyces sp. NPDC102415]|uniref:hypothetical protein n=1 Tax=Streptomyces sp. NPDC102415 TaxID=3366173 RepID=UPI0037F635A0
MSALSSVSSVRSVIEIRPGSGSYVREGASGGDPEGADAAMAAHMRLASDRLRLSLSGTDEQGAGE